MNRLDHNTQGEQLFNLSKHAEKRASQRGVPKKIIELIQIYGEEIHRGGGCVVRFISKKGLEFIYTEIGREERKVLKNKENAYIVENDGFVITAGYLYKKVVSH